MSDVENIIDLSLRRPPVVYTIEISHHWNDSLEVFVHDLSDDERSKAAVADDLRRAAEMFCPTHAEVRA